ncbi:Por secretion system C-terminal sorting domain-containing protein [Flavobacteriaceae bacterium MAR_2010_188]|nr:Por secretion system C-terminal sorting domain-containing protein [Flavobacteriaceae bacterium MAR_2010_188]
MKQPLLLILSLFFILSPAFSQVQIGEDIVGEENEGLGYYTILSGDGKILAILSNNWDQRQVHILEYKDGEWVKYGEDALGLDFGAPDVIRITLSEEGTTFATINEQIVQVYSYNSGQWISKGNIERQGYNPSNINLSSNGDILSISFIQISTTGDPNDTKYVTSVYKHEDGIWTQLGEDLIWDSDHGLDYGTLSKNGDILLVSGERATDRLLGSLYLGESILEIYKYQEGRWNLLGDVISYPVWVRKVSMSPDGSVVGLASDTTIFYEYSGGNWVQKGQQFPSIGGYQYNGDIAISDNGDIIVVGAYSTEGGDYEAKYRIYEYLESEWVQAGNTIDQIESSGYGDNVSLSADGSALAVGSFLSGMTYVGEGYEAQGLYKGLVRVYSIDGIVGQEDNDSTLGLIEDNISQVKIYPNPTSDVVETLLPKSIELKKVAISNLLGQTLLSTTSSTIDVSSLSQGTYFAEITTNKGRTVKKVIVK